MGAGGTGAGGTGQGDAAGGRLAGIGLMCGAVACFAGLDCTAKWLGTHGVAPTAVVWARYVVAMAIVGAVVNPLADPARVRTCRPGLQAVRSVLLLLSTAFNFVALRYLQLAETVSIQFATPLLVALLAGPVLGERIGPRRLAAIGVGFLGVLVVVRPGVGGMHPATLLCVANVVAYALYILATRRLAGLDSSTATTFYSGLAGVVVLTPALPWFWTAPPTALGWLLFAMLGVFGAVGHWLFVLAHARAPAGVLAPFIYTQLLWMLILGLAVFGDVPDPWTLAGSGIVVASGLYLLARERARGAAPALAPRAGDGPAGP